jgi:hypothetical protein
MPGGSPSRTQHRLGARRQALCLARGLAVAHSASLGGSPSPRLRVRELIVKIFDSVAITFESVIKMFDSIAKIFGTIAMTFESSVKVFASDDFVLFSGVYLFF